MSRKEEVVQRTAMNELKVNLPIGAVKLGSEVQAGARARVEEPSRRRATLERRPMMEVILNELIELDDHAGLKEGAMRVLDGEQTLVRIFIGEGDQWHHKPLARALLERLRAEGFAGATVIHGVAGFGANSVIHTASIIDLSADLPVLIEVVDDDEHVQKLVTILDEMLTGGALVTMEKVRVLRYANAPARGGSPRP